MSSGYARVALRLRVERRKPAPAHAAPAKSPRPWNLRGEYLRTMSRARAGAAVPMTQHALAVNLAFLARHAPFDPTLPGDELQLLAELQRALQAAAAPGARIASSRARVLEVLALARRGVVKGQQGRPLGWARLTLDVAARYVALAPEPHADEPTWSE